MFSSSHIRDSVGLIILDCILAGGYIYIMRKSRLRWFACGFIGLCMIMLTSKMTSVFGEARRLLITQFYGPNTLLFSVSLIPIILFFCYISVRSDNKNPVSILTDCAISDVMNDAIDGVNLYGLFAFPLEKIDNIILLIWLLNTWIAAMLTAYYIWMHYLAPGICSEKYVYEVSRKRKLFTQFPRLAVQIILITFRVYLWAKFQVVSIVFLAKNAISLILLAFSINSERTVLQPSTEEHKQQEQEKVIQIQNPASTEVPSAVSPITAR